MYFIFLFAPYLNTVFYKSGNVLQQAIVRILYFTKISISRHFTNYLNVICNVFKCKSGNYNKRMLGCGDNSFIGPQPNLLRFILSALRYGNPIY